MSNNYIIAVNERNEPFIAHVSGLGSWKNKAVKYVAKVRDENKTRYFYSQAELNAYRNSKNKNMRSSKSIIDDYDNNNDLILLADRTKIKRKKNAMNDQQTQSYPNRPTGHKKNVTESTKPKEGWSKRKLHGYWIDDPETFDYAKASITGNITAFGENKSEKTLIRMAQETADYLKESLTELEAMEKELDEMRDAVQSSKKWYNDSKKNPDRNTTDEYVAEMLANYQEARDDYLWARDFVKEYRKNYNKNLEIFKKAAEDYQRIKKKIVKQKTGQHDYGWNFDIYDNLYAVNLRTGEEIR